MKRRFYPSLNRAGIDAIRFHDLRHTYASLLIANGKEPDIISKIFNEENIGTIFLPSDTLSGKKHWIAYIFLV